MKYVYVVELIDIAIVKSDKLLTDDQIEELAYEEDHNGQTSQDVRIVDRQEFKEAQMTEATNEV